MSEIDFLDCLFDGPRCDNCRGKAVETYGGSRFCESCLKQRIGWEQNTPRVPEAPKKNHGKMHSIGLHT